MTSSPRRLGVSFSGLYGSTLTQEIRAELHSPFGGDSRVGITLAATQAHLAVLVKTPDVEQQVLYH